jgi:hypothetical protein
MIYAYNNATQTGWNRGEFNVQLNQADNPRPVGFCDGSPADLAELRAIAEAEGVDDVQIHKKQLKSGREIWTLGGPGDPGTYQNAFVAQEARGPAGRGSPSFRDAPA